MPPLRRPDGLHTHLAEVARGLAAAAGVGPDTLDADPWLGPVTARSLPGADTGVGIGVDALGLLHQRLLSSAQRREDGIFHTPDVSARRLAELGVEHLGRTPKLVADPACGGGALLVAVADVLLDRGIPAETAVASMRGSDLDASACRVAAVTLGLWAHRHGAAQWRPPYDAMVVGDALTDPAAHEPADLVVANPPFLGQLRTATATDSDRRAALRARWGEAVGPYTDESAIFLLAAVECCAPDGVVACIQPRSVLGGRDASTVRRRLTQNRSLATLLLDAGSFPGTAVRPCALVLVPRSDAANRTVVIDADDERETTDVGSDWGRCVERVPDFVAASERTLDDLAELSAGFRDEYYDVVVALREGGAGPRAMTSGLIDPLADHWGHRTARIGRRNWQRPTIDRAAVPARTTRWIDRQRRPKVIVANQTRMIEAVADRTGEMVGLTPGIVVLPRDGDVDRLAALLCSPVGSATAVRSAGGTGLGSGSVRLSARLLASLPVPHGDVAWAEATRQVAAIGPEHADLDALTRVAALMLEAHGLASDHPLLEWWRARLPSSVTGRPRNQGTT